MADDDDRDPNALLSELLVAQSIGELSVDELRKLFPSKDR